MYHLPNKNWRRIGHYNDLTHSDGTEPVPDYGDTENVLLTAKVTRAVTTDSDNTDDAETNNDYYYKQ